MADNEEIFDTTTTILFGELLAHFPLPVACDVIELAKKVHETVQTDKSQNHVINATIAWLSSNGYIKDEGLIPRRVEDVGMTSIVIMHQYILSDKSLALLKRLPSSLEETKNRIAEAIGETKNEARRQAIAAVVGEFFGGAIKGLANSL